MNDVSPELVRATLAERERSARRTFAVGRATKDGVETEPVSFVVECAWCERSKNPDAEGPIIVSHGICPECRAEHLPESLR